MRRNDPGRNEPGDPAVLREVCGEKPSGSIAGRRKRDGAGESTGDRFKARFFRSDRSGDILIGDLTSRVVDRAAALESHP
ncbi:hypothetical protein [Methanoculleus chikugoensis]|uniref:hypothetical protein n=1 Tax=Methanoculleus chikugoensis TaxID=118126 RepID=UPI001C8005BE|nr:hypothetical protein [Methanoculleus chikugoensis]